ncbi:putative n2,n2-dimethylguanosine trna methyltransferase [Globisporangium polare]
MSAGDEQQPPAETLIPLHVRVDDRPDAAQTLRFQCDWGVGIGGSIWTSGRILAEHLELQQARYRPLFQGKRVVELGSGTGYVGLMTAVCFEPAHVYLTDLATHVACLERNVAINAQVVRPGVNVRVAELSWGSSSQESAFLQTLKDEGSADTEKSTVDVILGTDVAYLRELYEPLLHTLRHIATEKTLILLGLNRADTDIAFFQRLEQDGFEYYKIADEQLHGDYHGKDFGLFEIRRSKPQAMKTSLGSLAN